MIEWLDPIYNAGHWMPELVQLAGGYDLLSAPGTFSVSMVWSRVADAGAEVLIVMHGGFDVHRTIKDAIELLAKRKSYHDIPATRSNNVWTFDANRLFSGASPALIVVWKFWHI